MADKHVIDEDEIIANATDISPDLPDLQDKLHKMSGFVPGIIKDATEMRELALSFIRSQMILFLCGSLGFATSQFIITHDHNRLDDLIGACWATMGLCCLANVFLFYRDASASRRVLAMGRAGAREKASDLLRFHMRACRMYVTITRTTPYQSILFRATSIFNISAAACSLVNLSSTMLKLW